MIIHVTDNEYGEIIGSLANTRDIATEAGRPAPHVHSALAKLGQWASPAGCQFIAVTGQDVAAIASREELSIVLWAIIENTSATGLEQACDALSTLPLAAGEDASRLIDVMRDEINQRRAAAQ